MAHDLQASAERMTHLGWDLWVLMLKTSLQLWLFSVIEAYERHLEMMRLLGQTCLIITAINIDSKRGMTNNDENNGEKETIFCSCAKIG
mmetsp:Transcript_7897/g.10041  ORF Transcript_7897/g.10041 Transcript_7897/m.10041 type:complete len:89 (-) Transcript_7897:20-286(-)